MPFQSRYKLFLLICLLVSTLLACNVLPNITIKGTPIVSSSTPLDQDTPSLNQWTQLTPGIEVRSEKWTNPANDSDTVVITRLDLHKVHLKIGYNSSRPLTMNEWQKQTDAHVIINGGYFDAHNQPTGLLITNGQAVGASYNGFGGMLAVDGQGNVSLRSLSQQPYHASTDQFQQATQSSPMLMIDGKRTQFSANAVNQRRSIVATDKQGRLLLIVSPGAAFTLDELADLLVSSDLSIKDALNLDGGASTGLYVNAGNQKVTIDAVTPLPIVILVK